MSHFLEQVMPTREYRLIAEFYGDSKAARSQVPLINHINEGVEIIGALSMRSEIDRFYAACGYCIHPLFQNDRELHTVGIAALDSERPPRTKAVMLAMEYRWRANNWLSDKVHDCIMSGMPDAGPIPEVRAMLIADKVQNYKDFLVHHKGTHARSAELDLYFKTWLRHLNVNEGEFFRLSAVAAAVKL